VGALSAVASPLIFLSICWSIISIGDISLVGKIGKLMIGRMIISTFVVCAFFTALYGSFIITFDKGTGFSADGLVDIYKMILAIVPPDIVTPFQTGNALQIIFLGVVSGVAMLILGDRVSGVKNDVGQLNSVVQYLMALISRLIPLFTFLSAFNLLLNKQGRIGDLVGILLLGAGGSYFLVLVYILIISVTLKVGVITLIKKLWPSHVIALTTASSIATLPISIETCEKKFGIPGRIANFLIPLGTVIFKQGGLIRYVALILPITQMLNINVSPVWLASAVVTISLCSIATPPIVGGVLSTLTVLFIQLGIPQEALGVAIAANSFLDITSCGCNVTCLQLEAVLGTNSLG
ncbi:MAG: cation:dicarboxylase symporter family transporter, partial [Synergistes sp.]|nr:cation:dicarboxylase symporter family transporter [Synergistes sp.]